jgi:hypothetical protein
MVQDRNLYRQNGYLSNVRLYVATTWLEFPIFPLAYSLPTSNPKSKSCKYNAQKARSIPEVADCRVDVPFFQIIPRFGRGHWGFGQVHRIVRSRHGCTAAWNSS